MGWADETGAPISAMTGKAVRPTLCLFGCEAVGGSPRQALPAAVALEFIHNFSLVHDDIQDEDETRHNRKTLWAVWGKPKALVAGNVLRVVADTALHSLELEGVEPKRSTYRRRPAYRVLSRNDRRPVPRPVLRGKAGHRNG